MTHETVLYIEEKELSRSFAPSEEQARRVAKWHCDKGPTNSAAIRELSTNALEWFRAEEKEIVSLSTGEILECCPGCAEKNVIIAMKDVAYHSLAAKYAALFADKEKTVKDAPEYVAFEDCFNFWRTICKHPRAEGDMPRYKLWIKFYRKDGRELCFRAIAGAASRPARNDYDGRPYDSWELIFRDRGKFESFCNRAPKDWKIIYNYQERESV